MKQLLLILLTTKAILEAFIELSGLIKEIIKERRSAEEIKALKEKLREIESQKDTDKQNNLH